ncbi:MAG: 5-formyltetrahydrofolate cyclo-ligase [Treponemataceae bacterium]|nr:5-formyltetrahydrofolate cyclo-ligase [Treponemataceae bacterium]
MDVFAEKQKCRLAVKNTIAKLTPAQKGLESAMKCAEFIRSDIFLRANIIFGFMPMNDELDVLPILRTALEQKKKVLLPKIRDSAYMDFYFIKEDLYRETEKSVYGMYEPFSKENPARFEKIVESCSLDEILVLVPGRAFGRDNSRLGRGKGYYDTFLRDLSHFYKENGGHDADKRPFYIGVCYDCQIFDSVPHATNDVFMDFLI